MVTRSAGAFRPAWVARAKRVNEALVAVIQITLWTSFAAIGHAQCGFISHRVGGESKTSQLGQLVAVNSNVGDPKEKRDAHICHEVE